MTTLIDEACWERGCPCHDERESKGVEVVEKKEWVDLTPEEGAEIWADCHDIEWRRIVPPKEIVKRISDKLKEKNT